MTRSSMILAALAALLTGGTSQSARAADWGNLKGRFVYDGKAPTPKTIDTGKEPICAKHNVVDETVLVGKDGGLANVVVYVTTKDVKVNPEYESSAKDKVVLDNNGCRFQPHILPMRVTQTLEIKNSDPFSHNSNIAPIGEEPKNPLLSTDASLEYHFHKQQKLPVPVSCNIHPWMKAHVVVKDNPYVAVSDKDGNFEIRDLPAEALEFIAWHENQGYLSAKSDWKKGAFKMKVKKGDNDLGDIKVDPKLVVPK
jgi:plastocyanin